MQECHFSKIQTLPSLQARVSRHFAVCDPASPILPSEEDPFFFSPSLAHTHTPSLSLSLSFSLLLFSAIRAFHPPPLPLPIPHPQDQDSHRAITPSDRRCPVWRPAPGTHRTTGRLVLRQPGGGGGLERAPSYQDAFSHLIHRLIRHSMSPRDELSRISLFFPNSFCLLAPQTCSSSQPMTFRDWQYTAQPQNRSLGLCPANNINPFF